MRKVVNWHTQQIETILERTAGLQNDAWLLSIQTAIRVMEKGWRAWLFPSRAAREVLISATQVRQSEITASGRWYISCLVESLAAIRLLSLGSGNAVWTSDYQSAKTLVLEHLKKRLDKRDTLTA